MSKISEETVERVIIKLPKSVAAYFRKAFPHGKRSEFVTKCILAHEHEAGVKNMEEELRKAIKRRQK